MYIRYVCIYQHRQSAKGHGYQIYSRPSYGHTDFHPEINSPHHFDHFDFIYITLSISFGCSYNS